MSITEEHYLGNPLLKKANTKIQFSNEQILEFARCAADPVYFARNYMKIVTIDHGLQPFEMWDFQERMLRDFHNYRFNICKLPRQVGKSTTVVAYLLHHMIFNDNSNIAILSNKASSSRDILQRFQTAYENLPKWLQHGILSWNKGSLELENKSRIFAESTSASSVRGRTYNLIFLDEFAFVPNQLADSFFNSVYPTIISGDSSKVIIVSTPLGMNHFYRLWTKAKKGENQYNPIEIKWNDVPGRDEKFKLDVIANSGLQQWNQEFCCEFLGSVDTLISGAKLSNMIQEEPIKSHAGLDIYEHPKKDHQYIITVDVARGVEIDYSAFVIIDITELPYKMVGKYRSNEIKPIVFPYIINDSAKAYNNAHVLCEVNDVGDQVAAGLHYDLEYPNLLMCSMRGRAGQVLGQGFSGMKVQLGLKMSKNTKKVGCFNLKALIEEDKLIIPDYDTIVELTTFVQKYNTFQAEEGCNDDLVMSLVLAAWVFCQDYFKEMTNTDIRAKLYEEKQNQMEQDMSPFGFIIDGTEGDNEFAVEADSMNVKDRWMRIKKSELGRNPDIIDLYPDPVDEYGGMQYMVDYIY